MSAQNSESLTLRITQYLFNPGSWVSEQALLRATGPAPIALNDGIIDLVAKSLQPKLLPPFFEKPSHRLVLLSQSEWHDLALGCLLLCYSGAITRQMDGQFRAMCKQVANADVIAQIDALALPDKPLFTGDWSCTQSTIEGAISAILRTLELPKDVYDYTVLRFANALPSANIDRLTLSQIEVACKISLPNLLPLLS